MDVWTDDGWMDGWMGGCMMKDGQSMANGWMGDDGSWMGGRWMGEWMINNGWMDG